MNYKRERNRLIKKAAEYADGVAGEIPIRGAVMSDKADRWNRAYFSKMDELAHSAGLTPWIKKQNERTENEEN